MAAQVLALLPCASLPACRLAPARRTQAQSARPAGIAPLRSLRATIPRVLCAAQGAQKDQLSPACPAQEAALESSGFLEKAALTLSVMATPLLLAPEASWAADGEFGILEGRTAALVHPAIMFVLFAASIYAGYLGWQWRRVRELGDEISALKKTVPEGASGEVSPVAAEVAKLTEERKALVQAGVRDKHWVAGSWLLAAGVGIAVEGCVNTYLRTGRLFPGPHLYAGALITVLWAAAAALVPAMQKGSDSARTAHIALNVANVLLFVSQIPTGLEIVGKVFEFTTWP